MRHLLTPGGRFDAGSKRIGGAMLLVAGSAGLAQALTAISSPLLARLYEPSAFGVFGVGLAVITILGSVAAGRYEGAVALPPSRDQALLLVQVGVACAMVMCGTVGGALALIAYQSDLELPALSWPGSLLLVLGAFLTALGLIFTQWLVRERRYGLTGRRLVLQAASVVLSQVLLAWWTESSGLLLGYLIGLAVGVLSIAVSARVPPLSWPTRGNARAWVDAAYAYRDFPIWGAPSKLINTLALSSPVLIFASLYGALEAGWLTMTQRLLIVPVSVVGIAAGQVFLGELADLVRRGVVGASDLFRSVSWRLGLTGLAAAIVCLALGRLVVPWLLGAAWTEAGIYVQVLGVSLGAQLLASPLASTLTALKRQRVLFLCDSLRLGMILMSMMWAHWYWGSPLATVVGLSASSTLSYGVFWLVCKREVVRFDENVRQSEGKA